FNVGVELGQLLVLLALIPVLGLVFRYVVAERMGTIILSALVAHTGWHWMLDRGDRLLQFPWPAVDALMMAAILRIAMLAVIAAAAAWIVLLVIRQRVKSSHVHSQQSNALRPPS